MRRAVFDASVLVKLADRERDSDEAMRAYSEVSEPMAPDWCMVECARALWKRVRRRVWTADDAITAFDTLSALSLQLHPANPLLPTAFALAIGLDHDVYDCLYLALALTEEAPLVTADAKLRDLAVAAGVETRWVGESA